VTPEDAFVADIMEHQDDDAPRLILADWLEDRGGPGDADRAEFIRVQCRRATIVEGHFEELGLRLRAEHLLRANWGNWVRPLARIVGKTHTEFWLVGDYHPESLHKFRRGFLYVLDLPARLFVERGEEILRWAPIRRVRFFEAGLVAGELARCPYLRWLERIDFIDYFGDPVNSRAMSALAQSPYLGALRGLGLYRNNLGDAGAEALAAARWLPGVLVLELGENGLSARGASALAAAPLFRPLRLLLGVNPIGDVGARALAISPVLSRLTTLWMDRCNLGPAAAQALAESPHLGNLRYLHLDGNSLGDGGALALARAPWIRQLASLHVDQERFRADALRTLREALRPEMLRLFEP
jgi:uncharacterized protein (TIGR02996 family)